MLSRLRDQKLVFGMPGQLAAWDGKQWVPIDPIELLIVEIRGDKVRLGVDANKAVSVHRLEVFNAIQRELSGDNAA